MIKLFRAQIRTNTLGGNIFVDIRANSVSQARDLIKQLPYFKSFVGSPIPIRESQDIDYDDLFGIEI